LSRRFFAAALVFASFWLLLTPQALPQPAASPSNGTVVVTLLTVTPGTPTATAVAAMKEVVAFVRKQPGLIDESLLASSFPDHSPSHIDLMRWRSLSDWEALFKSQEFLSLLESKGALFKVSPAEVFVPIK
jgi:hypothetical protein